MNKKAIYLLLIILVIIGGLFTYNKFFQNKTSEIKKETVEPTISPIQNDYIDTNPIIIGIYKYSKIKGKRELIKEYSNSWSYHQDIVSLEIFYTNEEEIEATLIRNYFDTFRNQYSNGNSYKTGFIINFTTNDTKVNKTILSPKDTEDFFDFLEIYLYDDYHRHGEWYSHTTEEEMTPDTIFTSIKLTAGQKIAEINSDILLTAFTYDNDDFDSYDNYRGQSKYSVIIKNSNNI